jgi:large subunit ribosomal protein L17
MLRGLVTSLLQNGRIETTEARAKEVRSIAEKLITSAVKEVDNFTTKQQKVSAVKLDAKGKKVTRIATSRNGKKYKVVEREIKTDMVTVDNPSRLHARRQAIYWIYQVKDENGKNLKVVNKLFDDLAAKYKDRNGGYTRIYKIGNRRGDAAPMVVLELV